MSISSFRTKIDLVRHELRSKGRRAAIERARFYFVLEPLGNMLSRSSYPRVEWGDGVVVHGRLELVGPGRVVIGNNCWFSNEAGYPNRISTVTPEAVVVLGDGVIMTGATIAAAQSVRIGNRTLLGSCTIWDTDFHPVGANARTDSKKTEPHPVTLGDDVWVGADAFILKGVTVGARAVIGAKAVIRESVAEDQVVVGNPQRIARELRPPGTGQTRREC
jgi:acetyltransferase-like isoleucine patch superfamily enzyme